MVGKIISESGKEYNACCLMNVVKPKYMESLREEFPAIDDLVIDTKNGQRMCWVDPCRPNWSFIKTLEKGERLEVKMGKVKMFIEGNENVQEVNFLDHVRG